MPTNAVAPLTPEEVELWHLLELERGGPESLQAYIPIVNPRYERPAHLSAVTDVIYNAAKVGNTHAAVSVPPRHGKSETILHSVPWFLSRPVELFPFAGLDKTIAYVSYEANFARAQSRKALDACKASGIPLRADVQALGEWRTPEGGGFIATGIGGPLTGRGVHFGIVDDPFKNRAEAESPTIRAKVWDWFTSTFLTRIEPGGSILVNMARWHDDDLIGRLKASTEVPWNVINLPAINDKGDPLWSSRWPLPFLDYKRRIVGPYDWASLFQGTPRPKGGRLFREPTRYRFPDLDGARIGIAIDPAASSKNSAHPSALVVLAVKQRKAPIPGEFEWSADVLEVIADRMEVPALVELAMQLQRKWNAPAFVEAVAGFKGVPQMMRALSGNKLTVIDVEPRGDKYTRALPASAAWNTGRIRVPIDASWVPGFLAVVTKFTGVGDASDDEVDALAHGWNEMTGAIGSGVRQGVY